MSILEEEEKSNILLAVRSDGEFTINETSDHRSLKEIMKKNLQLFSSLSDRSMSV